MRVTQSSQDDAKLSSSSHFPCCHKKNTRKVPIKDELSYSAGIDTTSFPFDIMIRTPNVICDFNIDHAVKIDSFHHKNTKLMSMCVIPSSLLIRPHQ